MYVERSCLALWLLHEGFGYTITDHPSTKRPGTENALTSALSGKADVSSNQPNSRT